MILSALLTSAGINIGLCTLFLSLYSILRKQPENVGVYFGRRLAQEGNRHRRAFSFDRLVPSAGWLVKTWKYTEEEILSIAGLDAVVFLRILVFSLRMFSIALVVCIFGVLPVNYFGQKLEHNIPSESLIVFTIENVPRGSQWLWVHCAALYILSLSACTLLFFEYRNIARMRLAHITKSPPNPRHFSVLVRAIPRIRTESLDETIVKFFTNYHGSSYLSHQTIYRVGTVQKVLSSAARVYNKFVRIRDSAFELRRQSSSYRCGLCGRNSHSFRMYHNDFVFDAKKPKVSIPVQVQKMPSYSYPYSHESSAAFVFFKTRYAAAVASRIPQSSNPMLWAVNLAPDPRDVYWSNLWIPYRQIWFRRIVVLMASFLLMIVFIPPVTFVQGLSKLDQLQHVFPFLEKILNKALVVQLVTGFLPSVILILAFYTIPPIMMFFSTVEGPISHSGRKNSACLKVLFFTIWNIFFVNVLSGSVIENIVSRPRDIPAQLAKAIPEQSTFFIPYVLTSGWTSLSAQLLQIFPLITNFIKKFLLRYGEESHSVLYFPYHTEVPTVLLFVLLGFTFSISAPLILPFLLVYFLLGYLVYRNQILNVYCTKYESGGRLWPLVHNTTIFSLVLTQIICIGVFGIKELPMASGFIIPLLIFTILFSEACRNHFGPVFKNLSAQDLIDMDRRDERSGKMEEIHQEVLGAYFQSPPNTDDIDLCDEDCSQHHMPQIPEGLDLCEIKRAATVEASSSSGPS